MRMRAYYSRQTAKQRLFDQKLDHLVLDIKRALEEAEDHENLDPHIHSRSADVRAFLTESKGKARRPIDMGMWNFLFGEGKMSSGLRGKQ